LHIYKSEDEEEEKMAIAVGSRAHMEADSIVEVWRIIVHRIL